MDGLRKEMCNWLMDTERYKSCVLDRNNEILFVPISGRFIQAICNGLKNLPPDFVLDENKIVLSDQSVSDYINQITKLIDVLGLKRENYEGMEMIDILYDLVPRVEELQSSFYEQEEVIDDLNKTIDELEKELESYK